MIIGETFIPKGKRKQIEIFIGSFFDYTKLTLPIDIIRGNEDGPTLFVSAAIHGDELNGVEVIKRLLSKKKLLANLKGTLIAVPIVNGFGFNNKNRYLPDRRDLNRCFPGSAKGSLGSRIADIFMKEIVSHCTHGIDLHTGASHRTNLPQIRACLDNQETKDLALAFGVPVVLDSDLRDGSLRQAAKLNGLRTLLFEGGEALRHEEKIIKSALNGIISVMHHIGMVEDIHIKKQHTSKQSFISKSSYWIRSPHSGSLKFKKNLGDLVKPNDILAVISNPLGKEKKLIRATSQGIIIGMTKIPLVSNGEGIFHIATFDNPKSVEEEVDIYDDMLE